LRKATFELRVKTTARKPGIQLWRVKAHEPEILRGEYIATSGSVKSFLQNSGCRNKKLSALED